MTTLREIASAAQIELKRMGDDSSIPFSLLVYYANMLVNKYLFIKYKRESMNDSPSAAPLATSNSLGGGGLVIYPDVPVVTPSVSQESQIVKGRKYIVIPAPILDLDGDRGIDYVTYHNSFIGRYPTFAHIRFERTTPRLALRLTDSTYEKPSPYNPYMYRVGDYIVLLGVEDINIDKVEIGLRLSFGTGNTEVGGAMTIDYCRDAKVIDQPINIDEYADQIIKELIALGNFAFMVPRDVTNDGTDNMRVQADMGKVVSVNNPNNDVLSTDIS